MAIRPSETHLGWKLVICVPDSWIGSGVQQISNAIQFVAIYHHDVKGGIISTNIFRIQINAKFFHDFNTLSRCISLNKPRIALIQECFTIIVRNTHRSSRINKTFHNTNVLHHAERGVTIHILDIKVITFKSQFIYDCCTCIVVI